MTRQMPDHARFKVGWGLPNEVMIKHNLPLVRGGSLWQYRSVPPSCNYGHPTGPPKCKPQNRHCAGHYITFLANNITTKPYLTRNTLRGTWYLPDSQFHDERTVTIVMAGCIAHARNGHISTSGLKYDVTIVFLDPEFLKIAKISASCLHLRQI